MLIMCANSPQSPGSSPGARASRGVDIGGRRLAVNCGGEGEPAVILETGLGAESHEWTEVIKGLEGLTRVLRYDRAGRGASDPAPGRRDARQLVDDLYQLLHITDTPGPYVLVGHSFGGLLMRLFAHRYSECVAAVVLVDSMHEDQFDVFAPLFPPSTPADAAVLRSVRAFWTGGWRDPKATVEHIDLASSVAQGRAIASLGNIPIHVIVAGTFLNQPAVPPEYRAALQRRWEELQQQFTKLSSAVSFTAVRSSGHFIQRDNPSAVIDVIRTAVAAARCSPTEVKSCCY